MAVRLRLRREGTKKQPHYRVVAADKRSPRDGKFIEIIGEYHPLHDPSTVEIDHERALHWLRHGAQPSSQVKKLLRIVGVWQEFKPGDEPERERSKLTQEQAEEAARQRAEAKAALEAEALKAPKADDQAEAAAADDETAEAAADETTETAEAAEDAVDETTEAAADDDAADDDPADEAAADEAAADEDDTEDEA